GRARGAGVGAAPGRAPFVPGVVAWATLCWEPGPRADELSRERRVERTPPIDTGRNASVAASVTDTLWAYAARAQPRGKERSRVEGHRDGPCATGGWRNSMAR